MQGVKLLRVTTWPHIRDVRTTQSIMGDVACALIPAGAFGIYYFGRRAAIIILISCLAAVGAEFLYNRIARKRQTIGDLSAVVTGLLLAYNLPVTVPYWIPAVGAALAILLVKMIFGGLGQNFANPALAARAILMISWLSIMSDSAMVVRGLDAVTAATSLVHEYPLWQLFVGQVPGCIGEVSKLALLVGGGYLLIRRVITWHIPVALLTTVFALSWLSSGSLVGSVNSAVYQLLSGGLILGAFFMATDYATSPVTWPGKLIFAVGCGLMAFVIRGYSPMAEGLSFSILFMNLFVPLIDRFTKPRVYGEGKRHA